MQNRGDLVDELLDFMGETGDDDARGTAIRILNRALETLWLKKPWTDHRMPGPYTFTTVANQRSYVLPEYFGRVAGFEEEIRNLTTGARLTPCSLDALEQAFPFTGSSLEVAGVPVVYAIGPPQGVTTQPTLGDNALKVASTSALDTTPIVVVEGLGLNGQWLRVQVPLQGLAGIIVGEFAQVINFTKGYPDGVDPPAEGATSVGKVTLYTDTGLVALESLGPLDSANERLTLILAPKPQSPELYAVPVIRAARRLASDSDELPRHWGPALLEEARLEFAYNQGTISLGQLTTSPRPRLTELVQHDNALLYRGMSVRPFA